MARARSAPPASALHRSCDGGDPSKPGVRSLHDQHLRRAEAATTGSVRRSQEGDSLQWRAQGSCALEEGSTQVGAPAPPRGGRPVRLERSVEREQRRPVGRVSLRLRLRQLVAEESHRLARERVHRDEKPSERQKGTVTRNRKTTTASFTMI